MLMSMNALVMDCVSIMTHANVSLAGRDSTVPSSRVK